MERRQQRGMIFCDIDGTIATNGVISPEMAQALLRLRYTPFFLQPTVITGRTTLSALTVLETLGEIKNKIITPSTYIGVENGARIIRPSGQLIDAFPIKIQNILPLITYWASSKYCRAITYSDLSHPKPQAWVPDQTVPTQYAQLGNSEVVDLLDGSQPIKNILKEALKNGNVTMLSILPRDDKKAEVMDGLKERHVIYSESPSGFIYFNHFGHSKAVAAAYIAGRMNRSLSQSFVLGNDPNDLEMLSLPIMAAVIIGFGLTSLAGTDERVDRLTRRGVINQITTPEYLAPELLNIVAGFMGIAYKEKKMRRKKK